MKSEAIFVFLEVSGFIVSSYYLWQDLCTKLLSFLVPFLWCLNFEISEHQPCYQYWMLTGISPPSSPQRIACSRFIPCLFGLVLRQAIGQESLWGIDYPAWNISLSDTRLPPAFISYLSSFTPLLSWILFFKYLEWIPFLSQSPSTPCSGFPY